MLKRTLIGAACLLFAGGLCLPAQDNKAELFGGYVYTKASPLTTASNKANMNGWVGSVTGFPARWFGVGGEISAVFGDISAPAGAALNAKEYSYLFGPQFRFLDNTKVQSSFKFLLGGVFGQVRLPAGVSADTAQQLLAAGYSAFDQTKFAMLMAVPVDYTITKAIAVRVEPGWYMTTFNKQKQNNFRLSIGPVFRFGSR
jgi:hypothetical protein